ncbi:MAG: PRC-barrel domain-containing protein [Candidatus Methanospirareceae archaeon]
MRVFALKLVAKKIVDTEGSEIGTLHNIIVDANTGILTDLVVKPAAKLDTSGYRKENNYIFIPFDAVKAIKDVIIVESGRITRA